MKSFKKIKKAPIQAASFSVTSEEFAQLDVSTIPKNVTLRIEEKTHVVEMQRDGKSLNMDLIAEHDPVEAELHLYRKLTRVAWEDSLEDYPQFQPRQGAGPGVLLSMSIELGNSEHPLDLLLGAYDVVAQSAAFKLEFAKEGFKLKQYS